MSTWVSLLTKYWRCTWLKTQQDIDEAGAELREAFRNKPADNAELCEVIRWMAGPEYNQRGCPTLRELIRGVWIYRNGGTDQATEIDRYPSCGYCKDGIITWRAGFSPDMEARTIMGLYSCSVPCGCKSGERAMHDKAPWKTLDASKRAELEGMAREAADQKDALLAAIDRVVIPEREAAVGICVAAENQREQAAYRPR